MVVEHVVGAESELELLYRVEAHLEIGDRPRSVDSVGPLP
jgi:hypothetical protein